MKTFAKLLGLLTLCGLLVFQHSTEAIAQDNNPSANSVNDDDDDDTNWGWVGLLGLAGLLGLRKKDHDDRDVRVRSTTTNPPRV
jgi:MYXO-CTERM domain-containing protein